MNKFENISYPFFGLKNKPYQVKYDLSKIYVQRSINSHLETVDDKNILGDYFARLATLEKRLRFDFTCKDLQELVYAGCKWGLDCNANVFDLSRIMTVRTYCHKIVKVRDNLIWVKDVSYPFKVPTNEKLELNEEIYATLIKIEDEWYLKEFSYEPSNQTYMRI